MPLPRARMPSYSSTGSPPPACHVKAALSFTFWVQVTCKVTPEKHGRVSSGKATWWDGTVCRAGEQLKWKGEPEKEEEGNNNTIVTIMAFLLVQLLACTTSSGRPYLCTPPEVSTPLFPINQISTLQFLHSIWHFQVFFFTTCPPPQMD